MSARGSDPGEVSWDLLAERLRVQRDEARADAAGWRAKYERLSGTLGTGATSETADADEFGGSGWPA